MFDGFNPLDVLAILVALAFGWYLMVCVRQGEFRYKRTDSMGRDRGVARVRRADSPGLFWFLAAAHAGVALYVLSFAFFG